MYLQLPKLDVCGPDTDRWDYPRVSTKLNAEQQAGSTFVLPLATIIETGNHITQIKGRSPLPFAQAFADIIRACCDDEIPWTAFSVQSELWTDDFLRTLANDWPLQADRRLSLGDATIGAVDNYYNELNRSVEILTGDGGLKALQPLPNPKPRRRR